MKARYKSRSITVWNRGLLYIERETMVTFAVADVHAKPFNVYRNQDVIGALDEYRKDCTSVLQSSDLTRQVPRRNGFVQTIVDCYNEHYDLVLRPDDVWLAIVSQFAFYVSGNADDLRDVFVRHDGVKELEVFGSGTLTTADYAALSTKMAHMLRENLNGDIADWVLPNFSTTTYNDTIVGAVMLMGTAKAYFGYKFSLKCGIPSVTLEGTPEDWDDVCTRAAKLRRYKCDAWADLLDPVLTQFVAASRGQIDKDFWNRVCHKTGGGSGPTWLSGWITVFCVYDEAGQWRGDGVIDMQDIPAGYVTVDVTVDDHGVEYKTKMFAGSMSSRKVESAMAPAQSWSICLM